MKSNLRGIALTVLCIANLAHAQRDNWELTYRTGIDSVVTESPATLIAMSGDGALMYSLRREHRSVYIDSIAQLTRTSGSGQFVRNVAIGSITVGAAGFMLGQALDQQNNEGASFKVWLPIAGLGLGAIFGSSLSSRPGAVTYVFDAMTYEEKAATMQSLLSHPGGSPPLPVRAGSSLVDVVYLKSGGVIRGTVTEVIPDSIVAIDTQESGHVVLSSVDVERITRENFRQVQHGESAELTADADLARPGDYRPVNVSFSLGAAIPLGDYADGAKLGIAGKGEVVFHPHPVFGVVGGVTACFNWLKAVPAGVDAGTFSAVFVQGGLRVGQDASLESRVYAQAQMGMLFGSTPSLSAAASGFLPGFSIPSVTEKAFSFSFGVGAIVSNRVNLSLSYLKGTASYAEISRTYVVMGEIPFEILWFGAGVNF